MIINQVGKGGSGGGGTKVVVKKPSLLNFYDYDGTLVESYDADEVQSLSALPSAPDHSTDSIPLTFQEWNWTLAQIKSYNTAYPDGDINVGATYVPTDGKTHVIFEICKYDEDGVKIDITTTGGTVNWGDGTTQTISSTSLSHVYASEGEYHCTLTGITRLNLAKGTGYTVKIKECRVGSGVTTVNFFPSFALETITLPTDVISFDAQAFTYCHSLECAVIPSSVTSLPTYLFYQCFAMRVVSLPYGISSIGDYAFYQCMKLESFTMPVGITRISTGMFFAALKVKSVVIPSGVTEISSYAFYIMHNIRELTMPSSVTSIGDYALNSLTGCHTITINRSSPPTLGSNMFHMYFPFSILVPSSAVSSYKSATNWSSYSSRIGAIPS